MVYKWNINTRLYLMERNILTVKNGKADDQFAGQFTER